MKNFFKNFSFLGMIMLMACMVLGVGDMSGAICADAAPLEPAGTGEGVTTPAKTGGMTDFDLRYHSNANIADIIKDPVDQTIVQIRPYANPIDTLLRYFNAENINNLEFGYYSIGTRPVSDVTTAAAVMNSSANKKAVYGTVKVSHPELFDITDTVFVTATDGTELELYVYKKDSSNGLYFTISEDSMTETASSSGIYTIPAFASGTDVYAMGRAASQKDVTSPALAMLPEKKTGYCQIFMAEIEQNTYEKMADKEIKWDLSEVEENVLFEYRRRMEGTWLRGKQGKIWDPEKGAYIYTTAGLLESITKTFTLNSTQTDGNAQLVALSKYVFSGNNGAKVRFAIAGSGAVEKISKMQGIERKQAATETEVVFGMTWSVIKTNFGQINLCHHEQLDDYGMTDKMVIVDPQFLKMKRVQGFQRQVVDGKEHLITNGDIVVFSEACGLAVYNPDVHCIVTVA